MANKKNNESGKENKYFGKYRGTVVQVDNSEGMFKVKANVPKLLDGYTTGWALPCLNFAFDGAIAGFDVAKGDMVWIEFEQGNLDLPIWTGGWFNKGQGPTFKGININGTLVEFHDDGIEIHGNCVVDGAVLCGSLTASADQDGGGTIEADGLITGKKNLEITGTVTATSTISGSDVRANNDSISLKDHVHTDVTKGGDDSGKPKA